MDGGNLSLWRACTAGGWEGCFAMEEEDWSGVGELTADCGGTGSCQRSIF
jgi:hypothetical protein